MTYCISIVGILRYLTDQCRGIYTRIFYLQFMSVRNVFKIR